MKARKNILLVVALVLVLSISAGLTMAYFSDYTAAKGGKPVTLGGETTIEEKQYNDHKDITISNTGDTDVIVRVAVYGPTAITYSGSGDWQQSGDYVYYTKVLPAGQKTSTITATWDVPADLGDDYNVIVTHESEQAVYDATGSIVKPDSTPAWAIVPAGN